MASKPQAHPSVRTSPASRASAARPSAARQRANRRNAQRSTGPRSAEGKARSSQNAVKHGLYSFGAKAFLKGNAMAANRDIVNNLADGLNEAFEPQDFAEALVVDRIAERHWRLHLLGLGRGIYASGLLKEAGVTALDVETRCVAFDLAEARLERSLSRQMRDLEFLQQRWTSRPRRGTSRYGLVPDPIPSASRREESAFPAPDETSYEAAGPDLVEPESTVPVVEAVTPTGSMPGSALAAPEPEVAERVHPESTDAAPAHPASEPDAWEMDESPDSASASTEPEGSEPAQAAAAEAESPYGPPVSTRVTLDGISRTYVRDGITYTSTTPFENDR